LHDSRYCKWSDAEAIPKWVADARLAEKPGGAEALAIDRILRGE
jgi:hypothetical protein